MRTLRSGKPLPDPPPVMKGSLGPMQSPPLTSTSSTTPTPTISAPKVGGGSVITNTSGGTGPPSRRQSTSAPLASFSSIAENIVGVCLEDEGGGARSNRSSRGRQKSGGSLKIVKQTTVTVPPPDPSPSGTEEQNEEQDPEVKPEELQQEEEDEDLPPAVIKVEGAELDIIDQQQGNENGNETLMPKTPQPQPSPSPSVSGTHTELRRSARCPKKKSPYQVEVKMMAVERDAQPFHEKCKICGKEIHNKSTYQKHMRMHIKAGEGGGGDPPQDVLQKNQKIQNQVSNKTKNIIIPDNEFLEEDGEEQGGEESSGFIMNEEFLLGFGGGSGQSQPSSSSSVRRPSQQFSSSPTKSGGTKRPVKCDQCGMSFTRNAHLYRHVLLHSGVKPYKCDICHNTFARKDHMYAHRAKHYSKLGNPANPSSLQKRVTPQLQNQQHQPVENPTPIRNAAPPPMSQDEIDSLHKRNICHLCGKKFLQRRYMLAHLRLHKMKEAMGLEPPRGAPKNQEEARVEQEAEQEEDDAEEMYDEMMESMLNPEVTIEDGEAPQQSQILQRSPPNLDEANLDTDDLDEFIDYDYNAMKQMRTESSSQEEELEEEEEDVMDISTDDNNRTPRKKMECSVCGIEFTDRMELRKHYKVHKKRYICRFCGLRLASAGSLMRHNRTHTGRKDFGCKLCGRRFSRKDTLLVHLQAHSRMTAKPEGPKPYVCKLCGVSYSMKVNLIRHLKLNHGNRVTTLKMIEEKYKDGIPSQNVEQMNMEELMMMGEEDSLSQDQMMMMQMQGHGGNDSNDMNEVDDEALFLDQEDQDGSKAEGNPNQIMMGNEEFNDDSNDAGMMAMMMNMSGGLPGEIQRNVSSDGSDNQFLQDFGEGGHHPANNGSGFVCNHCGKNFKNLKSLNTHKWYHSRDKLFTCPICQRGFKYSTDLARHINTHGTYRDISAAIIKAQHQAKQVERESQNQATKTQVQQQPSTSTSGQNQQNQQQKPKVIMVGSTRPSTNQAPSNPINNTANKPKTTSTTTTTITSGGNNINNNMQQLPSSRPGLRTQAARPQAPMPIHTSRGIAPPGVLDPRPYACKLCPQKFNHRSNLSRHMRLIHKIVNPKGQPIIANFANTRHNGQRFSNGVKAGEVYMNGGGGNDEGEEIEVEIEPEILSQEITTIKYPNPPEFEGQQGGNDDGEDNFELTVLRTVKRGEDGEIESDEDFLNESDNIPNTVPPGTAPPLEIDQEESEGLQEEEEEEIQYGRTMRPGGGNGHSSSSSFYHHHQQQHVQRERLPPPMMRMMGGIGGGLLSPCELCGKQFTNKKARADHVWYCKRQKIFRCPVSECRRDFKLKHDFIRHLSRHACEKRYGCRICPARFPHKMDSIRHMKELHNFQGKTREYACDFCEQNYLRDFELANHLQSSHKLEWADVFDTEEGEMDEMEYGLGGGGEEGEYPQEFMMDDEEALGLEMEMEEDDGIPDPMAFLETSMGSGGTTSINPGGGGGGGSHSHHHLTQTEGSYHCSTCNKDFSTRQKWMYHRYYHIREEKYDCPECEEKFKLRGHLERHLKTYHSPDKPVFRILNCRYCPRKFTREYDLSAHIQKVHKMNIDMRHSATVNKSPPKPLPKLMRPVATPPPPAGPGGGNQQRNPMSLLKPMPKLTPASSLSRGNNNSMMMNKPFIAKSFNNVANSTLRRNWPPQGQGQSQQQQIVRKQTTVTSTVTSASASSKPQQNTSSGSDLIVLKPNGHYYCRPCNKTFTEKKSVDAHRYYHNREEKHFCTSCNARFKQKSDLQRHIRIHHNSNNPRDTIPCPHCFRSFTDLRYLRMHFRRHHPDLPDTTLDETGVNGDDESSFMDEEDPDQKTMEEIEFMQYQSELELQEQEGDEGEEGVVDDDVEGVGVAAQLVITCEGCGEEIDALNIQEHDCPAGGGMNSNVQQNEEVDENGEVIFQEDQDEQGQFEYEEIENGGNEQEEFNEDDPLAINNMNDEGEEVEGEEQGQQEEGEDSSIIPIEDEDITNTNPAAVNDSKSEGDIEEAKSPSTTTTPTVPTRRSSVQ